MLGKTVISRYDPKRGELYESSFEYCFSEGMSVLDVLRVIRRDADPTLSFSASCRNGKCGLCALEVDGIPCLACDTPAKPEMHIAPLSRLPKLFDLMLDRVSASEKLNRLRPYLIRSTEAEIPETVILGNQLGAFEQGRECIECLCCMDVCPILRKKNETFAGPMVFVRMARFLFDPRDDFDRKEQLKQNGLYDCISCSLCSKVCPMGIDPAGLITKLKENI